MKSICLINSGENIKVLRYIIDNDKINAVVYNDDLIDGVKYVVLEDGKSDIVVVKNYNPLFLIKDVSGCDVEICNRGYEVVCKDDGGLSLLQKQKGIKYIVKPLEKLSDIARKFGLDEKDIIERNNLKTNMLFVGQVLII